MTAEALHKRGKHLGASACLRSCNTTICSACRTLDFRSGFYEAMATDLGSPLWSPTLATMPSFWTSPYLGGWRAYVEATYGEPEYNAVYGPQRPEGELCAQYR